MLRPSARALAFALACAGGASAREEAALSDYEKESIRFALDEVDGTIDENPEGKWIEDIDVVTLDVIEPRDPAPQFLNYFHVTSRKSVIDSEVLVRPGERYDRERVEESERNLRVRQLSVVLIVPIRTEAADRVRLLVVTKDVWSLRVNFEPLLVNGRLQSLYLQPSEENLFGRHKILNGNILLSRATYSMGLGFVDPRVAGSRLSAYASAGLAFNCLTNDVEGSYGAFRYGKPLYSTRTRWSWVAAADWSESILRPYGTVGDSICSSGGRSLPVDYVGTPETESVPYEYHQDSLAAQFSVTRSFGILHKQDVTLGVEGNRRAYQPPEELADESAEFQQAFRRVIPRSNRRMSPFVQLHARETRYQRMLDVETLGLQEDHVLGYDFWLRAYPASKDVGSSRDIFGTFAGAGYTVPLGTGLARAYVTSTVEFARAKEMDAEVSGALRVVSPRMPFGRFVFDGFVLDRYRNYLNTLQVLGGTTRLRGYRTSAFVGPNVVTANFEVRSRPVEILSVEVGAVAFYDVGNAFREYGPDTLSSLHHGAGGGLRFVFPQVERTVFRVDVGVPLGPESPAAETTVVAQFRHAFGMPQMLSPGIAQ